MIAGIPEQAGRLRSQRFRAQTKTAGDPSPAIQRVDYSTDYDDFASTAAFCGSERISSSSNWK